MKKLFKSYLGRDAVYNFINSMIEESKYFSHKIKKHFNKNIAMTKRGDNDEKSTKCWIWDNNYVDDDVKERDHCYITGKYKGYSHRDCNIRVKLNHKTPIGFPGLKELRFTSYYAMNL